MHGAMLSVLYRNGSDCADHDAEDDDNDDNDKEYDEEDDEDAIGISIGKRPGL